MPPAPVRSARARRQGRRWLRGFGGQIANCSVDSSSAFASRRTYRTPRWQARRLFWRKYLCVQDRGGRAPGFFNQPRFRTATAAEQAIEPGHGVAATAAADAARTSCSKRRIFARVGLRRPGVFRLAGLRLRSRSARGPVPAAREEVCRPTWGLRSSGPSAALQPLYHLCQKGPPGTDLRKATPQPRPGPTRGGNAMCGCP